MARQPEGTCSDRGGVIVNVLMTMNRLGIYVESDLLIPRQVEAVHLVISRKEDIT